MAKRRIIAICFVALAVSVGLAQEMPVTKTADNGPSLEITMKFIQEQLRANSFWTDVTADPASCEFRAIGRYDPDPDDNVQSITFQFSFRDVSQVEATSHSFTVDMKPGKSVDHFKEITHKGGKPHNRSITFHESEFYSRALPDEDLGNRLAKAMVHAVELCSGSSKPEPF